MKMDPDNLLRYLDFVSERHAIWERRQLGEPRPWTTDPTMARYRFTNVFRVLDRGTQWPLRELYLPMLEVIRSQEGTPEWRARYGSRELLMRAFYYRITNQPVGWEAMREHFGYYPTVADLGDPELAAAWDAATADGVALYRKAYRTPQPYSGVPKRTAQLRWVRELFTPGSSADLMPSFVAAASMRGRYEALCAVPGVGPFTAMQVLTDYGYVTEGDEDEFVVAGVGAVRGAALLAPGEAPERVIAELQRIVLLQPDVPTISTATGVRTPSLMDIQNTLCEYDKLVRWAVEPDHRSQYQEVADDAAPPPLVLPPHW